MEDKSDYIGYIGFFVMVVLWCLFGFNYIFNDFMNIL